jgi:hypothetical protein
MQCDGSLPRKDEPYAWTQLGTSPPGRSRIVRRRGDLQSLRRGVKRDAAVRAWLNDDTDELRTIARKWFMQMRRCGDDVRELMHDGCPVACVGDAAFGYVNTFTNHVNVGFFHGAFLDDPAGLLQGTGKRMRHVKLTPDREPDSQALCDLIRVAYTDILTSSR